MGRACGTDGGNVKLTLFTVGNLERKRPFIAVNATEGIILNLILKICFGMYTEFVQRRIGSGRGFLGAG
jgi:hypothetical protein